MHRSLWLAVLCVLLVGSVHRADGYSLEIHRDFHDFAFGDGEGEPVEVPGTADLDAFRRMIWQRASDDEAFRARWPTVEAFDEAAFKEFLGLNPARDVRGIDRAAPSGIDARTAWREAAIYPDTDDRNQDRLTTVDGEVLVGADGKAVPYDPRTVWFGGRTGVASQFDAHGALTRGEKTDSFWTALTDPANFSRPPEPLGSVPRFSQSYADLAVVARLTGGPGDHWLGINFAGNAFHGIEDVGNQIHTTLIGIPEFFIDAKKVVYRRKIGSFFGGIGRWFSRLVGGDDRAEEDGAREVGPRGLVGLDPLRSVPQDELDAAVHRIHDEGTTEGIDPRVLYALDELETGPPTDEQVGARIIGSHHRLLEDFFQVSYLEARDDHYRHGNVEAIDPTTLREVFRRAEAGDPAFERTLRDALDGAGEDRGEWTAIITEELVEASAPEAAPLYRAIRSISLPELKREGAYRPDAGDEPMAFVTTTRGEDVDTIHRLHARAFARVVTALRLWREEFEERTDAVPGSAEAEARVDEIVDRLVDRQLSYLDAAAERRVEYLREVARETGGDPGAVRDPLDADAERGITDVIEEETGE